MDPRDREFSDRALIISDGVDSAKIIPEGEIEALDVIRSIQFDVPNDGDTVRLLDSTWDDDPLGTDL